MAEHCIQAVTFGDHFGSEAAIPPAVQLRSPRFSALHFSRLPAVGAVMAAAAAGSILSGTENSTTAFPNGGEDFLVGAMPPPGWYGTLYVQHYSAGQLYDGTGTALGAPFDFNVTAITPRLDWVKPARLWGADRWGTLFVLPELDLDLAITPPSGGTLHERKRGLADLTIGNGLHWTLGKFEMINSFDVVLPTGAYDRAALVNPGLHRWVVRLNHIGTWFPSERMEFSYRLHWDHNFRNTATDYQSGQTIYLNWAAGWKPQPQTTLGVTGFFLRQIADDRQGSGRVGPDGHRLRVSGIGFAVKHFLPNRVMLTAKCYRDFDVRHHPRGTQFWVYVAVPLR